MAARTVLVSHSLRLPADPCFPLTRHWYICHSNRRGGSLTSSSKILIVAAFALLLAGAAGARTSGKVIANGTLLKGGLYAYAQANAVGPSSLSAKIATTPNQKILLQWSVSCSNLQTANGAVGADAYDPTTKQKSGQKSVT